MKVKVGFGVRAVDVKSVGFTQIVILEDDAELANYAEGHSSF